MFGNFKAQKAPTENNIFCPSSEKVRSCREKNQFMSAIAEWWIYIMRSALLICFTDSQLNNEESPLFFHYLKWTSWTSYYRKSEVSGGLPCFTTKKIIIPNCFNRCWFSSQQKQKIHITRHISTDLQMTRNSKVWSYHLGEDSPDPKAPFWHVKRPIEPSTFIFIFWLLIVVNSWGASKR